MADMQVRRIELACGVLGGVLGFIALGVGLFAPVWHWYCDPDFGQSSCNPDYTGVHFALAGQAGIVEFYTTMVALPSLGIVLFAIWHSRTLSLPALVLLWVCTVLLSLQTVNVGLTALYGPYGVLGFFVPAAVLALGASIMGTVAARQRVPVHP